MGAPPLPTFFLLLLLLAGFVPPVAAQSPPAASLQPGGMLTMREHAVPTDVHLNATSGNDNLDGAQGVAVSGDGALLFVTANGLDNGALSVWRVNAEAGTLTQTQLHQDITTGSLNGADYLAVSGDGKLLFVTAYLDHTISVWRVNAEAGTLMRNSVYQGSLDGTRGLFGVRGIVVSGELLFVAADSADTLGVWRVNAEEGTLSLAALYQDSRVDQADSKYIENVAGRVDGLRQATGVAVSGDGKLLFVTGPRDLTLSVWRVNAEAGTLSQTALYQDPDASFRINEVDGRFDGLAGARNPAVSGDGALLFVTGQFDDALSVWRVNAEAGTLSQTALYQDSGALNRINEVDGRVDGLSGVRNAVVSGDGALLFVTAIQDNTLSVWRVNAEAGTLSQTALHRNGENRIRGLGGATGATVSGDDDLLFVTGEADDALSVWRINNAEVPFGVPVMISVQSDLPVAEEVVVTVTAQSGADMVEATATLSPSTPSADAIFPPGTLRPSGRWTFTAQASPPTALDTSAARIAMQVLPPLLSLEPQQDQFAQGSAIALTVRTIAGLLEPASFEIDAVNETTTTITVEYPAGATEQEVLFPAEDIAMSGLGQLDFFIRLPDNSPFRVGDGPAATVQIVIPQLQLVPQQNQFFLGSSVILTVQADPAALEEATYTIIARRLDLATSVEVAVTHPAGVTAQEVSFSPEQIESLGLGQLEFSIQLPDGSPFQVMADGTTEVEVLPAPAVSLQPGGVLTMREHAVPTDEHLDETPGIDGLGGAQGVAASGDLLFVTGRDDNALSVWRIDAEAGTLMQAMVYRDDEIGIDGLTTAWEVVVSASGNLLFVTAESDALSVWRVNAEAATLSQLVVYQDDQDQNGTMIEGLAGAGGAVLSGDLLFVTGFFDSALSVWQVNESSGTLRQTAVYTNASTDNAGNQVDGLDGATDVAVSGDLLFVTGFNGGSLSIWRVNESSGTLEQTAVYRNDEVAGITGLLGAQSVAVSGSLLFVTGLNEDALSVWRVNAEAGELSQIVVYRNGDPDGDSEIRGLEGAQDVAVSGDLLFVTGNSESTLSVWRVNAEAGTLSQTVVYQDSSRDSDSGINVLNGANNIAISGDLLFVTALDDNALSAWHINNAEVSLEEPTVVRVESDMPVAEEVVVTVTASNGAQAMVTLSSGASSAEAIFPAGTLEPGRQIFTAQATPPAALDTEAARIAMQVLPPLLSLETQQQRLAMGSGVVLTLRTIAGVPMDTIYTVTAMSTDPGQPITAIDIDQTLPANTTSQEVVFTAGQIATLGLGQLAFSISALSADSPFRIGDGSAATVQILTPQLQLVPQQNQFALGSAVILTVQADPAALIEATYTIIARHLDLATSVEVAVTHPAGVTAQEVSFSPEQIESLGLGQLEFSIQLPDGSPFQVMADGTTIVEVRQVQLTLQLEAPTEVAARDDFAVRVSSVPAVPEGATVTVIVSFGETDSSPVMLSAATTSAAVMFTAPPRVDETLTLTAFGSGESNIVLVVVTGAAAEVALVPQPVQLTLTAVPDRVAAGEDVMVKVGVEPALLADTTLTVTVTFGDAQAPDPVTLTDMLSSQSVTFMAPAVEAMEQLVVRTEVMAVMPEGLVAATTVEQTVEVLPAGTVALTLAAPENVIVGNTFTVTVGVEEGTPLADNTTVTATISLQNESGEDVAVEVELTPTMSLNTRILTAPLRAGDFTVAVSRSSEDEFAGDVLPTSAQVSAEAVALVLQLSGPNTVIPGSTYQVTVQIDEALPEDTVLAVTVSAGTDVQEVVELSQMMSSGTVSLRAPLMMGEVVVTATVEQTTGDAREVAVTVAGPLTVAVAAEQVQLALQLEVPTEVVARDDFEVTVLSVPAVPEGATVTVTVVFDGTTSAAMTLTPGISTAVFSITAPGRLVQSLALMALGEAEVADANVLQVSVTPATAAVAVVPQPVQLTLTAVPARVAAGEEVTVTVGVEPAPLAGTTLTVTVTFGDAEAPGPVTLTDMLSSGSVTIMAPAVEAMEQLVVRTEVMAVMPEGLVAATTVEQTVEVLPAGTVALTLAAPENVTVGSTFMVTVGVEEGTPLAQGTTVTATISLQNENGDDVAEPVVVELTPTMSLNTPILTAPVTAGSYTVAVMGVAGNVLPSSAQVSADAVVLRLELSGPAVVEVEQNYQVTVETDEPVPEGTMVTVTVTVSDGTVETEAVMLTADNPSGEFTFTAPLTMGDLTVMATAQVQTDPDTREVATPDTATLTVFAAIPTPLSLQLGGTLTRMGDVMPIELYDPGLFGDGRMAVSGELLFAAWENTLSVWRVNAEAGTLSQTIVYENDGLDNVDNTINGLNGANDIAVSGDLVFVVAFFDDALSVWQVNESSGTLRQTAVYTNASTDNAGNQVDGLGGAVVVDVSDNLLFVGGLDDNALSVWEVNEASGTLRQTAVYLDSAPEVDGLRRVTTIAVSDDLLFVAATGSEALSAWQINADGTLIQTDLHRHSLPGVGLRSVGSMAVSGDLLFVPDAASNRLGVWRVNRETSTLSQTVVYLNSDPEIDGLEEVEGLAVSGGLLFVTSGDDDSLSVWEINALAGTLSQTVVYEDEEDGINGLDGAFDVVANGDLLFVLGGTDNAISTWRILIEVEVRFEAPLTISVQSDTPVAREVVVTITASNGAEATATIPAGESSAEAIFAPGTLEPGTQTFTATSEPPALLDTDTRAARIDAQVQAPVELTLEPQTNVVTVGDTLTVTVGVSADTPLLEGVPVTATISLQNESGEDVADSVEVVLTLAMSSTELIFTAPSIAGEFRVEVSAVAIGTSVLVTVEPLAVSLQLSGAEAVTAERDYQVTVGTDRDLPAGTVVNVEVQFGGATGTVTLSSTNTIMETTLVAPSVAGEQALTASGEVMTQGVLAVAVADATALSVRVREAGTIGLTLSVPDEVEAGSVFSVTVGTDDAALLSEEGVSAMVTFEGSTEPATLSASAATAVVMFTAPGSPVDEYVLNAMGTGTTPPMTVEPASASVTVVPVPIMLTLTAPGVVDGGSTFTAMVGTDDDLPEGTTVNASVQLGSESMPAVLSAMTRTASVEFTAPSSGTFSLTTLVTEINQSSPVVAVSPSTPVDVQATELVTSGLMLSVPDEVEAGSAFSVTVQTDGSVPAGVEVSVMVIFDGRTEPATLSASAVTATVMFTAPGTTTGPFVVEANGMAAATDMLRLTVTLTTESVTVVPVPIMLTLTAPGVVNGGSEFTATVGTNNVLPEGTTVNVAVQLGSDTMTMPAALTAAMSSASVAFTAPSSGIFSLTAAVTTITQSSPVVAVSEPLPVVMVQATELVTLDLMLSTPSVAVVVGNMFIVTVSATTAVLERTEVSAVEVAVVFEGSTQIAVLSATTPTAMVDFTAPSTAGNFVVNATGMASVTDENVLQLTVSPTSASVTVVPVPIMLTLTPSDSVVRAGSTFTVTVGTEPVLPDGTELPDGTMVAATVEFNGVPMPVMLIGGSTATVSVEFTAPSRGLLPVTAEGSVTVQGDPVVAIFPATPVDVQVTEKVTLRLILEDVPEQVEVGSDFSVMVSTVPRLSELPVGATVEVTVTVRSDDGTLLSMQSSVLRNRMMGEAITSFGAVFPVPSTSIGIFDVDAVGTSVSVTNSDALILKVDPASTSVEVEPLTTMLTLMTPRTVVSEDEMLPVTVGVVQEMPLPEGTIVEVTVQFFGSDSMTTVTLTASDPTASTMIMAPSIAGQYLLTASATVQTIGDSAVAVNNATSVTVRVREAGTIGLILRSVPEEPVEAGSTFSVTVATDVLVPEGAGVSLVVTFAGSTRTETLSENTQTVTVMFTAPGTQTGMFTVNAMGTGMDPLRVDGVDAASTEVVVVPVTITLTMAPSSDLVMRAGEILPVTVEVTQDTPLPAGTVVALMVQLGSESMPATLTATTPTASVEFTVPESGRLALTAEVVEITQSNPVVEVSAPTPVNVQVTEVITLALMSVPSTPVVEAGSAFSVMVETDQPVPDGATVTVMVTIQESTRTSMQTATLPAGETMAAVMFTVLGTTTGTVDVDAVGTAEVAEPDALSLMVTPAASTSVVVVPVGIMLTLTPDSLVVDAGGILSVEVGVAQDTPLPAGTVVALMVQLGSESMPATLSATTSTASVEFTAPESGRLALTAEVGEITQSSPVVTVSVPTPVMMVQVTRMVTLGLSLSVPSTPVEAGSAFSVMVETDAEVPPGGMVTVAVTFDGSGSMQTETATLSAAGGTAVPVMFTAPGMTGTFTLTATGTTNVENANALVLTLTQAADAEVTVVPLAIALTLTPDALVVDAGGTLSVDVGTEPALSLGLGTEVDVTVRFGDDTRQAMLNGASIDTVVFTAPESGLLALTAEATNTTQGDTVVAVTDAAPAMVQVTQLVTLGLILNVPEEVEAGSMFNVEVMTDDQAVPLGATVAVTVTFDGSMRTETLSADELLATVAFMAPGTMTGSFSVDAAGMATVENTNALQVTVNPTTASVEVVPMMIALTLVAPSVVDGGSTFTATVGTDPALPEGTVVNVAVQLDGGEPMPVTLSNQDSNARVVFTAPELGLLDLTAEVTNTMQGNPVVRVEGTTIQVQVRQLVTLSLRLVVLNEETGQPVDMPPAEVEAGSSFSVRVDTNQPLPEGAAATVTVTFDGVDSPPLVLSSAMGAGVRRFDLLFTAPNTTGTFTVTAISSTPQVADPDMLRLTLSPASAQVLVGPATRRLVLTPASFVVVEGNQLSVEVGTAGPLPDGAEVEVTVRLGSGSESTVMLTADSPTADAMITAPDADENMQMQALSASGTVIDQGDLDVILVDATPVVFVRVREVGTIGLILSVLDEETGQPVEMPPAEVEAGSIFSVMVATDVPVPTTAEISVTVEFEGSTQPAMLSGNTQMVTVMFTAPGTAGTFEMNATGTTGTGLSVVDAATTEVVVVPVAIMLTLVPSSRVVAAGDTLDVEVGTDRALPVNTVVNVAVQFGDDTISAVLNDGASTTSVAFTAPPRGLLQLSASVTVTQGVAEVDVSVPDPVDVQVTELLDIMLTVSAQPNVVTVGATFTVTVGAETPLPEGTTAEVMAVFEGVTVPVTLSGGQSETVQFTAPVTAGVFAVEVSGRVAETDALRVTVLGASTPVTVEPVALQLRLSDPGAVTVGSTYQVTVDTEVLVPTGTTLTVSVSAGTEPPEMVELTADNPSEDVTFTAPVRAATVSVTAMATTDTDLGALEVAVSDAEALTVAVSALEVQLVLEVPSEPVAANSLFSVTVVAAPVPGGTTVTVSLADFSSEPIMLTLGASEMSVTVTAPADGGPAVLRATGMEVPGGALELNVLPATATVQVQEQVQLALRLEVPAAVTARDTFEVTVSSEPEVPEGTTVTVTVNFDGADSEPVALSAGMTSADVMLMAPEDLVPDGLELLTTSMVAVDEPDALQVTVVETTASVDVVAQSVQLTLMAPERATANQPVEVTVGVSPALLADTVLTVEVAFGESTQQITLSDTMTSERVVTFTAPDASQRGRLDVEVSAREIAVEPVGLVVAATVTQTVLVLVEGAVVLTVDAPPSVTVGDTFMVTVGVDQETPLPEGTAVTATVSFPAETADSTEQVVVLTPGMSPAHADVHGAGHGGHLCGGSDGRHGR